MVPGMCQVVLVLPTSQHNEMRVLFLITLLRRLWKVTHGLHCNKALALLPTLVVVIPRHEIWRRHPDGLKLSDPIFKHHNLYRVKFISRVP